MKYLSMDEVRGLISSCGRTFFDEQERVLYSNYTCGGFEIAFEGQFLGAVFRAIPDTLLPPGTVPDPERKDWPRIGVLADGSEELCRVLTVKDGEPVTLWLSEQPGVHRIRIVKLNENFRTALGLQTVITDGSLQACSREQKPVMELIGDSITCGFGNETRETGHEFRCSEENGWMAHGAQAARLLGFEPRFISVSGIAVQADPNLPGTYGMEQLYPYADRIIQDRLAARRGETVKEYLPYDFDSEPASYVVLNLGTNDANQIYFATDRAAAEAAFRVHYRQLVETIRTLNGPETTIICALGCMSYYLFDEISEVVSQYKAETGDQRISTLKYGKMMNVGPDAGACLHPTVHRHTIMARELARKIRSLEGR